jgi:hypothetical protein
MNNASFIDYLNTYLREELPVVPTPQASINDDLRPYLDMLVFSLRKRIYQNHPRLEYDGN